MLTILIFILIGSLAGFLSGLLGIGGGLIVVPGLDWLFLKTNMVPHESIMQVSVGSSLAAMIFTTQASLRSHLKKGAAVWDIYKKLAPGIVVGSIAGVNLADELHSEVIQVFFGVVMLLIAVKYFMDFKPKPSTTLPRGIILFGITFVFGGLSSLLGIGGSAFIMPLLTYCNIPIRRTMAVAVACGFTIAIMGTLTFIGTGLNEKGMPDWSTGYVYWPAVAAISVASMLCVPIGVNLAYKLNDKTIKKLFAVALIIISADMLWP